MCSKAVARGLLKWLLISVLFGNAIATGVCGTLCVTRHCCHGAMPVPSATIAPSMSPHCPHCEGERANGQAVRCNTGEDDCCAWIGKKIEPPATVYNVFVAS